MSYGRLEINLLPPEFRPGPSVRALLLINVALILGTLTATVVGTAISLTSIAYLKSQIAERQAEVNSLATIQNNYETLQGIKESVQQYGRIVSLASADYVEIPVLLDRISRLLPDGVYLRDVGNRKGNRNTTGTIVRIGLTASRQDPELIIRTLNAFKNDPIFQDCYMSMAESKESPLGLVLLANNITWKVSGPDINPDPVTQELEFEIQSRVLSPVPVEGLPVSQDFSSYLTDIKFKVPPPEEKDKKGKKATSKPAGATGAAAPADAAEGGAK